MPVARQVHAGVLGIYCGDGLGRLDEGHRSTSYRNTGNYTKYISLGELIIFIHTSKQGIPAVSQ
jgi:hypothetical protein